MNIKKNVNFSTRIILGFSVIIVGIIFLWIIALNSFNHIIQAKATLDDTQELVIDLTQLRSYQNRLNTLLVLATISDSEEEVAQHLNELSDIWQGIDAHFLEGEARMEGIPDALPLFRQVATLKDNSRENQKRQIVLIHDGQSNAALEMYKKVVSPVWADLNRHIVSLENMAIEYADYLFEHSESRVQKSYFSISSIGLVVIIIVLYIIIAMLRVISRITRDIKKGVSVLGSSTSEIFATIGEISTGAAETATAISETSTTIEEVRQTSMVSGKKAKFLMDSSQKASEIGEQGLESSQKMVDAMDKIDAQMKNIHNTITKLSDQNRSIGEITSTVADIADQSNLLAVNAAIEAAKAGEHGRGFSVVAQEIRNLAKQSKKSTTQVKEILNEIQKSVLHTVEMINHGSKTVEDGNNSVAEDRLVVEALIENVNETAEAAVQISSSSQQQIAGLDQIVPAMENIKQASEQNVTGVRQTQDAVKNLHVLSDNLKDVIERYRL